MKLLYLDCCISVREESRTRQLAEVFLEAWKEHHPYGEITRLDLRALPLMPLGETALHVRQNTVAHGRWDHQGLALARQFAQADRIVAAAPFWGMLFPAKLQTYLEHISVSGITFHYTPNGPHGLCQAEKFLYLTTAGGSIEGCNFAGEYLRALSKFYGIPEFDFVAAPMQDVQEIDTVPYLEQAFQEARTLAKRF